MVLMPKMLLMPTKWTSNQAATNDICIPPPFLTIIQILSSEDNVKKWSFRLICHRITNIMSFVVSQKACRSYLRNAVSGMDYVLLMVERHSLVTAPIARWRRRPETPLLEVLLLRLYLMMLRTWMQHLKTIRGQTSHLPAACARYYPYKLTSRQRSCFYNRWLRLLATNATFCPSFTVS